MHNSYKIDSVKQILDQNQVRKYQKDQQIHVQVSTPTLYWTIGLR